eukprot:1185502-Prorocentrum_minimum.AAC.5
MGVVSAGFVSVAASMFATRARALVQSAVRATGWRVAAGSNLKTRVQSTSLIHSSTPRPQWQDPKTGYKHFGGSTVHGVPYYNPYMLYGFAGATLIGSCYYFSCLETIPLTGRSHFIIVSPQTEQQLGRSALQSIMDEFRGSVLPPNHPATRKVARIGHRIVAALNEPFEKGANLNHLRGVQWEYFVIDSDMVNAFVVSEP